MKSPSLGRWNVAVATQWPAVPPTSPVDASTPDGASAAITGALAASISSITWSAGVRGEPEEPVPSSASTITCARGSLPGSEARGGADAVGAVVALAADGGDPPGRGPPGHHVGEALARPLHQLLAGDALLGHRPAIELFGLARLAQPLHPSGEGA